MYSDILLPEAERPLLYVVKHSASDGDVHIKILVKEKEMVYRSRNDQSVTECRGRLGTESQAHRRLS